MTKQLSFPFSDTRFFELSVDARLVYVFLLHGNISLDINTITFDVAKVLWKKGSTTRSVVRRAGHALLDLEPHFIDLSGPVVSFVALDPASAFGFGGINVQA
jgi:hypothetical protein